MFLPLAPPVTKGWMYLINEVSVDLSQPTRGHRPLVIFLYFIYPNI